MNVKRRKRAKPKIITTIEMEVAIAKYFGVRIHIIVPNISWGLQEMHECDLFFIERNGYAFEVEIKRSKSDLIADFKKGHNHRDKQHRLQELYYAIPENLYESCKDIIPQNAGILVCDKWIDDDGREIVSVYSRRPAKKRINARKLTIQEQLKVAKLGTMRIWSLKEKIIKLQNDRTKV
jgi:hypothetical protein